MHQQLHQSLVWGTVIAAATSASFWIISARAKVLSEGTSGFGALVGGYLVVPGPKGERIDLIHSVRKQSIWNTRAAFASAATAVLTALQNVLY